VKGSILSLHLPRDELNRTAKSKQSAANSRVSQNKTPKQNNPNPPMLKVELKTSKRFRFLCNNTNSSNLITAISNGDLLRLILTNQTTGARTAGLSYAVCRVIDCIRLKRVSAYCQAETLVDPTRLIVDFSTENPNYGSEDKRFEAFSLSSTYPASLNVKVPKDSYAGSWMSADSNLWTAFTITQGKGLTVLDLDVDIVFQDIYNQGNSAAASSYSAGGPAGAILGNMMYAGLPNILSAPVYIPDGPNNVF
jgi:hypothetical protein